MKKILLAALVVLALVAFAAGYATAQESHPAAEPAASAPAQPADHEAHAAAPEATPQAAKAPHKPAGEEEGEETAAFKESPSVQFLARITGLSLHGAYWLAVVVNFLIIVAAIVWLLRSSLPGFFRDRTTSIQMQIDEARRASADAQRRLSDVQARLSRLDQEIAALHAGADKDAAAEQERIRAAGEEDRQKMVETTRAEIEAARRQAEGQLKAYAAELAVGLAAQRLTVDPATDRQLVRTFAEDLGEEARNGRR